MINATWKFILDSDELGQKELDFAPEGWDAQRVSLMRSPTYKGIRRGVSTSLRFVGDGLEYLQTLYENHGPDTNARIGVYQYYTKPTDKYLLYFAGIVDLSPYFNEENIFVECDIAESSFAKKLMSRDSVNINLNTTESIEGISLEPINEVEVQLHQRELLQTGEYDLNDATSSIIDIGGIALEETGASLPIQLGATDIENLTDPYNSELNEEGSTFWSASEIDANVRFIGSIKGELTRAVIVTPGSHELKILFRVYSDDTLTSWYDDGPLWTFNGDLETLPAFDFEFNRLLSNISAGSYVSLVLVSTVLTGVYDVQFDEIDIGVEYNEFFDTTTAPGYFVYDAFEKIIEAITDTKGTFKSDYFDVGGDGYLQTIHSGKQIRNIPDSFVSLSMEDIFKSLDSQHNIGIGIEYDSTGNPYVRCEKESYFYSGNVMMTLNNVSELTKEAARDLIYNEIEVGYVKAEYEEVNGLEEYNNRFEWVNKISSIKNTLDLISPIRADGYGIEFARRKQYENAPTEDTKYDNDNFTISVTDTNGFIASKRLEGYDFAENIFSPESAYNLDFTPGRMIRPHGGKIRAGLRRYLNDPIKFQFAEQKADLYSQKIGEAAILENENIDVNTLDAPLWICDKYKFNSVLTREQLATITRTPNGIIKFSSASKEGTTSYKYGYLVEVDNESDKDTAIWELLRVDTTSPNVRLIDPEGDTGDIEEPPVEPSNTFGIFEGGFEFVFSG